GQNFFFLPWCLALLVPFADCFGFFVFLSLLGSVHSPMGWYLHIFRRHRFSVHIGFEFIMGMDGALDSEFAMVDKVL
ncbi:hypothetical protein M501DRAFT_994396, partial [Patellaria atrata CBS 101060]